MFTINPSDFTVLIVDDTPVNLQILGSNLKSEKFKVEFAVNGIKALEWLKQKPFDIVLLDIMMPEMSGFEVCEKIRSDSNFDDMPVIFLTAKSDSESIIRGFELGAQDYVTKPFDTKELLIRVKTQLELKQSKERIKSINLTLEQKVAERTIELAKANIELEKANRDLLSLDKAKAQFTRMISHEIRTPLNGILGPLHILKDKAESEEIIKLINLLNESVKRLEEYSLTAIRITELSTGQYKVKADQININELLEFCRLDIKEKLSDKHIILELNIDSELYLTGDYDLLFSTIKIIILTLIRFYFEGGKISFSAYKENSTVSLHFSFSKLSKYSKEIRIDFDFEQGKENWDHSGIDIHLAKLIIENHSGTIQIKEAGDALDVILQFEQNKKGLPDNDGSVNV